MANRRQFLKTAFVGGTVASLLPRFVSAKQIDGKDGGGKRALRIAHITDVHIFDQANAETCFARVLREINQMKDKPDLIINTGDTVMDENKQTRDTVEIRWNAWNRIVKAENSIPIKSALG